MGIEKLKRHKSPGIDQVPAEMIKAGGRTILFEIHKLINSIWNKVELPEERKESIVVRIYRKCEKEIVVITETFHIFCTRLDHPWLLPSLLYCGYRLSFPGIKRPGVWSWPPTPFTAEVKERVELYIYPPSGPWEPLLGWMLSYTVFQFQIVRSTRI